MSVAEVQPKTAEQPPVYFAGGLGYGAVRNQAALHYLEEAHGVETLPPLPDPNIAPNDSYQLVMGGLGKQLTTRQAAKYAGDPKVEMLTSDFQRKRAGELLDSLEKDKNPKVDAIFQSADALNGLMAVHEKPERFNNVVLAYPAGIAQQPKLFEASRGVLKTGAVSKLSDVRKRNNPLYNFEAGIQVKPKRGESVAKVIAPSVALSYQAPLLSEVRQREDAPGVSLVLGLKDHMMPPKSVIQSLRSQDDVDYILVTNKPHAVNGDKSTMDEVMKLFPSMEQIKAAKLRREEVGTLSERLIFTDDVPAARKAELMAAAAKVGANSNQLAAAA
jgi:hypothetical protein